jgi:carbamoylphosphate synthase small subunit
MCAPAVAAALTIASTAASVAAQAQAAHAQNAANARQAQNAITAQNANLAQVNLEQTQQADATQQKLQQNDLAARSAVATARTAAGENGVGGLSVDALIADIGTKQNTYETSVRSNYENTIGALDNQRSNIYASAQSTINGLRSPAMPDYFGAALRINGAYDDYRRRTDPNYKPYTS